MLSRGFYDALALWPTAAWAIVVSSAFWAFLRLCGVGSGHSGVSLIAASRWAETTAWVFVPAAALFEAAMHLYLLWAIGWFYAFAALPVFIFGWVVLPMLLDDLAPALALLIAVHVVAAAALVVLLGFAEIGPLRALNTEIYSLLTGVRVSL